MYSEVIAASVINKLGAIPNYLLLGEKHTTYILIKICNRGFRACVIRCARSLAGGP